MTDDEINRMLDAMTKAERSLLLYVEARAVDHEVTESLDHHLARRVAHE